MKINFGEILTRAWQITWKYKVLWIFGILAGCTNGGGGGSGGGNSGYRFGPSDSNLPPEMKRFFHEMGNFVSWVEDNLWLFIAVMVLVFLVLIVISVFLGTIGRIGLIKGSYEAEQGAEKLVFGELFSTSMSYFWRVFGLSFLVGLAFFILLLPLILIGFLSAGVGFLCLLPLICLLIPIAIVVNIVIEQANRAIVLEDLGLVDGFKRGWEIARSNIGPILIMALILFGISFVLGIVIALPIIIIVFPTVFAFILGEGGSFTPLYLALACICLYAPVSWLLNGILSTFTQSAWTLTYLRLTQIIETPEAPVFAEPDA
jgi:ABC-type multidrug transport system fused ATPase/permease subunit